jgi:hypothetical protein
VTLLGVIPALLIPRLGPRGAEALTPPVAVAAESPGQPTGRTTGIT